MKSEPDATGNVSWLCKLTGKFRKHIPIFFFFLNPGTPPSPAFRSAVALISQSGLGL